MGRAVIFIVFLIGFVLFALLKMIFSGTKAAYEAVFDPNAKDERIKALIEDCMLRVSHSMYQNYTGKSGELTLAILQLTPVVQSLILDRGYKANSDEARSIVCQAIVMGGHATQEEVNRA